MGKHGMINQPKRFFLYDHYLLFSFIDCFGFRERLLTIDEGGGGGGDGKFWGRAVFFGAHIWDGP